MISVTWPVYIKMCQHLAKKIPSNKYKAIYAVPRGGLIIGTILSHKLELDLHVNDTDFDWNKISADEILIVDDLADSGRTLEPFVNAGFDTATLFYKPFSKIEPTYWLQKTRVWVRFPYEVR